MAMKPSVKPYVGMPIRNKVSRKVHFIKKLSLVEGWILIEGQQNGWFHLSNYTLLRKKGKKPDGKEST